MYKLIGIWSAPRAEDVEAFEKHHGEVHAVLASKVPHLRRIVCKLTSDRVARCDNPETGWVPTVGLAGDGSGLPETT